MKQNSYTIYSWDANKSNNKYRMVMVYAYLLCMLWNYSMYTEKNKNKTETDMARDWEQRTRGGLIIIQ